MDSPVLANPVRTGSPASWLRPIPNQMELPPSPAAFPGSPMGQKTEVDSPHSTPHKTSQIKDHSRGGILKGVI